MDRGAIISGAGHLGLILWVILGDWLFAPSDMPPVEVAQVSLMSAAEYDAMVPDRCFLLSGLDPVIALR